MAVEQLDHLAGMPRHIAARSLRPVLDGLEHQLVAADQLDRRPPPQVGQATGSPRRPTSRRSEPQRDAHREQHELGGGVLGDRAHRGDRERLVERLGVHVVEPADLHPHPGHRPFARALLDGVDDRAAQSELVHRLILPLGDDLDPHVDVGLDPQHQDPGRFHAEVADVEGRSALERIVRSSTTLMRHLVLVAAAHAPERQVAGRPGSGRRRRRRFDPVSTPSIVGNRRASMRRLQLAVLEPVARREPVDRKRQLRRRLRRPGRRRPPSQRLEVDVALEPVGGRVDRVQARPRRRSRPATARARCGSRATRGLHLPDLQVAGDVGQRPMTTTTRRAARAPTARGGDHHGHIAGS